MHSWTSHSVNSRSKWLSSGIILFMWPSDERQRYIVMGDDVSMKHRLSLAEVIDRMIHRIYIEFPKSNLSTTCMWQRLSTLGAHHESEDLKGISIKQASAQHL